MVRDDVFWFEDKFSHNTKDIEWLPVAGANQWLVIVRDKKIRTRPGERRVLMEHNVGCFIVNQKRNPSRWEYLKLLAATLDKMEEFFATTPRPFMCKNRCVWQVKPRVNPVTPPRTPRSGRPSPRCPSPSGPPPATRSCPKPARAPPPPRCAPPCLPPPASPSASAPR